MGHLPWASLGPLPSPLRVLFLRLLLNTSPEGAFAPFSPLALIQGISPTPRSTSPFFLLCFHSLLDGGDWFLFLQQGLTLQSRQPCADREAVVVILGCHLACIWNELQSKNEGYTCDPILEGGRHRLLIGS